MSNIDKQALTAESARESGNILLIVAARMARRELFTPLHYVSELPQKVVSLRVFREALERSEETLQREVCKIVDGHDLMQKKLKEAEAKLEAAEKRIAELESREVKPVAWRCDSGSIANRRVVTVSEFVADSWAEKGMDVSPLYTAPPTPAFVPEPIKRNDADGWWMYKGRRVGGGCAEWYNRALDDCRAAMLQVAEPVTTAISCTK